MSHVDDGTLHAYLDGALTPADRARLEAHVAECAPCRSRLDEERALIERTSGLLGLALPPERAAPPLHQLRRPSVVWRLRVPVAWAATVLLALGLGYYAGDQAAPEPASKTLAAETDSSATAIATRQDNAPRFSAGASQDRLSRQRQAPPVAQLRPAQERKEAERDAATVESASVVRGPDSVLGTAAASGVIAIRTRDTGAANAAPAPTARAEAPQRVLDEVAVRPGSAAARLPDARALVATQWPIIRRGPARQILGAEPMGVPGLAVRNIRRSPTGEVVLVEQAIDSVTVIQLFQQRVEHEDLSYSSRDAARTERLARFIGGVRVEIAGPLSADSLNRLLEQVKPIAP